MPRPDINLDPETIEQAAYWAAQLAGEDATEGDRDACERWCNESPSNRLAMDRMRALDGRLGETSPIERQALQTTMDARKRRQQWLGGSAAALGALAVSVGWYMTRPIGREELVSYETTAGKQLSIRLADGSDLLLDTASSISIDINEDHRVVILKQGRLSATVAHGRASFIVKSAHGTATALGTRFTVRADTDDETVTVAESRVNACDNGSAGLPRCMTLAPGERVRLSARGLVSLDRIDPKAATEWTEGWLAVNDRPVAEVLLELNRYRTRPVTFDASALSGRRVSGTFPLMQPERALDAVALTAGLRIVRAEDGGVTVTRK